MIGLPDDKSKLSVVLKRLNTYPDEKLIEVRKKIEENFIKFRNMEQSEINKLAAEFHGITLDQLVMSGSYKDLLEGYQDSMLLKLKDFLEEHLEDEELASAIIYHCCI